MKKKWFHLLSLIFIAGLFITLNSCKTTKTGDTHKHSESYRDKKFAEEYSKKLNIPLSGREDKKLIKAVAGWIGTPYKYGGASKTGTDCSGFVMNIYQEVYNKKLGRSVNDIYEKNVRIIKKSELKEGDVVFFKIETKKPGHIGLYIKGNKFVHASSKRGVTTNSLEEAYYKKYYFASGRVK
ncbi:MAG: C40 family peptidase [Bacteroidota bacterium]